jgi:two-component system, cell cycle sensor histidine kinase and response regulator CckA
VEALHGELDSLRARLAESEEKASRIAQEIRDQEASNRLLLEQLHQAQKMQAIGTLAGGIAHEFNNVLGAIIGYTSLLKNMMKENHPFFGPVTTIERSAERAADLTRKLLGFARGGKYRADPVSLNDVVHRVLPIIQRTFDRAIAIESRLEDPLPSTEGDMGQLEHSLLNLCLNARDAMPNGGRLSIETAAAEIGEEFVALHPWARTGGFVRLTVTDTGVGMTAETRKRIFEPFFTTKKPGPGGGSGMGLAMVYGAVKNHGGFIEVHSDPGRGTTMSLFLPVGWRTRQEDLSPAAHTVRGGTETILVVDDEPALRDLAETVLSSAGYRVLAVGNGEEACAVLQQDREKKIGLVLLDIEMPGMGGKQAFLTMRGIRPKVPVLIATGHGIEGPASEILQMGGNGFLGKPFRVKELLHAVRRTLDSK